MSQRIAVLTSGGDAAGMNASIRALTRTAIAQGIEVIGVQDGYAGLLEGEMQRLKRRDVGGILQFGGTYLGSSRSEEFPTEEGQTKALEQLKKHGIDGLVVIGGNGSLMGGWGLQQRGVHVVGIPATIDNDVYGTEMTLGVDTTLNIALEAIDRIRTTASSHKRGFLVEVMGRDSGYLALQAGLAGGAEAIVIPEVPVSPAKIAEIIREAYARGKKHAIVVVAEGAECNVDRIKEYMKANQSDAGFLMRTTILGHVQRGGAPTAYDRLLGTRFGHAAAMAISNKKSGVMVAQQRGSVTTADLKNASLRAENVNLDLLEMARVLAR